MHYGKCVKFTHPLKKKREKWENSPEAEIEQAVEMCHHAPDLEYAEGGHRKKAQLSEEAEASAKYEKDG